MYNYRHSRPDGPASVRVRRTLAALTLALFCLDGFAARNVILFIGDGMDDQQITIARNYLVGARGKLTMDRLPVRGVSQVLTVSETGEPVYVADSANSATAIATGVVTSRGRIATSAGTDRPLKTIVEILHPRGYRTGLVTTSSVTDATPASFVAHINVRYCENPETIHGVSYGPLTLPDCPEYTKANGGPGSISEQIAASDVDVVLGGGLNHFAMKAEGSDKTVMRLAEDNGYRVVRNLEELAAAPAGGKLLGLFSELNLPVKTRGENGRGAEKPTPSLANRINRHLGSVEMPEIMVCEPNPDFASVPTLEQLTRAALERLENETGFFLMVESASIDKQAHERKPCGSIGELEQIDEALGSALAFAERHPDTLILVTSDHAQAAQLVPATSTFELYGVPVYTPGKIARIRTPEGAVMAVNYATNNFVYEEHTGGNVPVFANDEGSGRVPTMLTQPELFDIVRDYLFEE